MSDSNKRKQPQRRALGRGLSALISTPAVSITPPPVVPPLPGVNNESLQAASLPATGDSEMVQFLDIDCLSGNAAQPRKDFDEQELNELADSIRSLGVIQPILARPVGDRFEIIAGERRWRAAKLAGLTQLPVITRDIDDRRTLEIALVENIQRSNLNPVEEARAFQSLIEEFNLSQQELAQRVGRDRTSIANYLRLLRLPESVLEMLRSGDLTMGHAKAILTVKEPAAQLNLAQKCVRESLSVRGIEEIVSRVVVLKKRKKVKRDLQGAAYPEVVDRLRAELGTKVTIKSTGDRGVLEIHYFSEPELDRIVEQIAR